MNSTAPGAGGCARSAAWNAAISAFHGGRVVVLAVVARRRQQRPQQQDQQQHARGLHRLASSTGSEP
ncbi:hypothetical protein IMW82_17050 [Rhodanobacter sp. B2A1Ga4]|uniref:hypothetical protein n=1 Tax=Rhodanobacter thiooxydans TaxID=416169 RepID=UPI00131F0BAF|nr:hypothetical protein [Rhodanobacter sp. B2A1Ga4]